LVVIFGIGFSLDFPSVQTRASAVTFALTPADSAPDDALHSAAANQQGEQETDPALDLYPGATLSIAQSEPTAATPDTGAEEQQVVDRREATSKEGGAQSDSASQSNPRAGSVAARRALDADYLLRWRRRVEQVGNALYRRATARYGSGDVRLLVVVVADGTLDQVRVITPSGKPELDQAAVDTVRRAAPFPAFPRELREQTQRLEIIRTWQFRAQVNPATGA
jgi:protein TonB